MMFQVVLGKSTFGDVLMADHNVYWGSFGLYVIAVSVGFYGFYRWRKWQKSRMS